MFLVTGLTKEDLQEVDTNEHRMIGGYRFEFNGASTGHVTLKIVDLLWTGVLAMLCYSVVNYLSAIWFNNSYNAYQPRKYD